MKHLVSIEELSGKGRPLPARMDRERLLCYLTETEQLQIKPVLGEKLFLDLQDKGEEEPYRTLLEGGTYSSCSGSERCFTGLKAAIAYFVQAKHVMVGDFQPTRYGTVFKESEYSSRLSSKERADCYNDALEVANCYLKDCLEYCRQTGLLQGERSGARTVGGMRIRKIGK